MRKLSEEEMKHLLEKKDTFNCTLYRIAITQELEDFLDLTLISKDKKCVIIELENDLVVFSWGNIWDSFPESFIGQLTMYESTYMMLLYTDSKERNPYTSTIIEMTRAELTTLLV